MPPFFCPYCPEDYAAPSEELLFGHIRIVHANDPNFSIQCSFNGCERTFTNFRTWQNHRLLHYRSGTIDTVSPTDTDEDVVGFPDSDASATHVSSPSVPDMQRFAAQWILKTRETRMLTRSAMQGIIENVDVLVGYVTEGLKSQTQMVLENHGIKPESIIINDLDNVFTGPVTKPFQGLTSFHQQLQYCRSMFNLVVRLYKCCLGSVTCMYKRHFP